MLFGECLKLVEPVVGVIASGSLIENLEFKEQPVHICLCLVLLQDVGEVPGCLPQFLGLENVLRGCHEVLGDGGELRTLGSLGDILLLSQRGGALWNRLCHLGLGGSSYLDIWEPSFYAFIHNSNRRISVIIKMR